MSSHPYTEYRQERLQQIVDRQNMVIDEYQRTLDATREELAFWKQEAEIARTTIDTGCPCICTSGGCS